jgi:hypothetical protein
MLKFFFLMGRLSLSFSAWSNGNEWYQCEVRELYSVSDKGALTMKAEGYRGEAFKVDRLKNVIIGNKVNTIYNKDIVSSNPTNQGIYSLVNYSRKNDGQIRRLSSLTIQDYDEVKPFVFTEGNYIITGICH